jgi:hypothetical protein
VNALHDRATLLAALLTVISMVFPALGPPPETALDDGTAAVLIQAYTATLAGALNDEVPGASWMTR